MPAVQPVFGGGGYPSPEMYLGPETGVPIPPVPSESTWDQRVGKDIGPDTWISTRKDLGSEAEKGPGTRDRGAPPHPMNGQIPVKI